MDLYAAHRTDVWRVDPQRGEARAAPAFRDRSVECLAVGPETVYVGTFDSGLWRSRGEGFERVPLAADCVMAVAVSPHDPETVWAGTEPSRVHCSRDGGETWDVCDGLTDLPSATEWAFPPRPHTHHVRWIEPDPAQRERLYVAVEAGALVRTDDGGTTWHDRTPNGPRDTHTVATHPDQPGAAVVAAGDGYAETTDGGDSWTFPAGLERGYCWSVATPPDDPDTVVVSAARSAREAHTAARAETYCYRHDRETGAWERLDERGLPLGRGVTRPVLARGRRAGELFALSNRGLFHTTDAGDSWSAVGVDWPDRVAETTARGLAVRE